MRLPQKAPCVTQRAQMPSTTLPIRVAPSRHEARPASADSTLNVNRARARPSTSREIAAVIALATLLGCALCHQAWAHPTTMKIGDFGHRKEYDWFLAWVPYALARPQPLVFQLRQLSPSDQPHVEHLNTTTAPRHGSAHSPLWAYILQQPADDHRPPS